MSQRRRKLDLLVAKLQLEHGPRAIRKAAPNERRPPSRASRPRSRSSTLSSAAGCRPVASARSAGRPPRAKSSSPRKRSAPHTPQIATRSPRKWTPSQTGDSDYYHRCGIDLSSLLAVRPATLAVVLNVAASRSLTVLVIDPLPREPGLAGARVQLGQEPAGTPTVALFLTESEDTAPALAHSAPVRIGLRREQWLRRY